MSFDQEPERDVHDECAHEISRLQEEVKQLRALLRHGQLNVLSAQKASFQREFCEGMFAGWLTDADVILKNTLGGQ